MRRTLPLIIALLLAVTVAIPVTTSESHAASTYAVRTSMPGYSSTAGKAYYYTNSNIFYKIGLAPTKKKRGVVNRYYVTGNCTWYAYARASEILGHNLDSNFRWAAGKWWSVNKSKKIYPYGKTPKAGAIACYKNHVAIVEKVENGKVYYSESGWRKSKNKPTSVGSLCFHYSTKCWGSGFQGYIYFTKSTGTGGTDETVTIDPNNGKTEDKVKDVNYEVTISVGCLNQRKGPGTSYDTVGYIKKGTYKVVQEKGKWLKLANGYWVHSDYVTVAAIVEKAKETAEEVLATADKSATTEKKTEEKTEKKTEEKAKVIKVKITVTDLRMRSGPGTTYKIMGKIKPGTYEVSKIKGDWCKIKKNGYWVCKKYVKQL